MNQVRLQNLIGRTSLQGQIIKLHPTKPRAYVACDPTDEEAFATVAQSVPNTYWGLVNPINTIAPPTRIVTASTTEKKTDYTIMGDSAIGIYVYLLPATGSNRVLEISNIGAGDITVVVHGDPSDPSNMDTIDDETSQTVSQWDNMVIKDYTQGKFKIE